MPGRPSRAESYGLVVETFQEPGGTSGITLTDPDGTVVFEKGGYAHDKGAKEGANRWVGQHYRAVRKREMASSTQSTVGLIAMMRKKAQEAQDQAARLRIQADLLEEEAKRLFASSDVLEGPLDG